MDGGNEERERERERERNAKLQTQTTHTQAYANDTRTCLRPLLLSSSRRPRLRPVWRRMVPPDPRRLHLCLHHPSPPESSSPLSTLGCLLLTLGCEAAGGPELVANLPHLLNLAVVPVLPPSHGLLAPLLHDSRDTAYRLYHRRYVCEGLLVVVALAPDHVSHLPGARTREIVGRCEGFISECGRRERERAGGRGRGRTRTRVICLTSGCTVLTSPVLAFLILTVAGCRFFSVSSGSEGKGGSE
jgi:hypothetical protein